MEYEIVQWNGSYFWRLRDEGRIIAQSHDLFTNEESCRRAIQEIKSASMPPTVDMTKAGSN